MTENIIFNELNPAQKKAVEVLRGPLLILAGAGSGKTRVLTHRVANLIAHGVSAENILAVTFTNKAAKEMEGRIERLISTMSEPGFNGPQNPGSKKPAIGTFHSICVRILRQEIESLGLGYNRNFVIFDTNDTLRLIKIIMKEQKPRP